MSWPKIESIVESLSSGQTTATENVKLALSNIKKNSQYQTVISTLDKEALERAKLIDLDILNNKKVAKLAGVPFIAKDNFLVFGAPTTAASNILKGFHAPYQATAIDKLESEGAICVAKANMDAFAHGSSTENSDFFVTKNPYDLERVAGGSSGGSAASVALDIVPFSVGTDTGGSIRQPASFCNVVGFKPSYGMVSRSGVIAMGSSLDTIGTFSKNIADTRYVMSIISGRDPFDSTTLDDSFKIVNKHQKMTLSKIKIGIIKEYLADDLNPDVKKVILSAINKIKRMGLVVDEVSIPSIDLALSVYYVLCPAEVASNLSRYDGQRFGYSYLEASNLEDSYLKSRTIGFGDEAKTRIMIGTYVLSSGYYDAYYKKAQTVRTKLINDFNQVFKNYDFLIGPTVPDVAFKIGEKSSSKLEMYLNDIMTVAANLVGIPAISLPAGFVNNLPVGLQLMGQIGKDNQLLDFCQEIEENIC